MAGCAILGRGAAGLTRASVSERLRLLEEGPGLIDPLAILLATYRGDSPGRCMYGAGLSVYDLLALQRTHRYYSAVSFKQFVPFISDEGLQGGFRFGDAQTDDAWLVLQVLSEAAVDGVLVLNYTKVESVICERGAGRVIGALDPGSCQRSRISHRRACSRRRKGHRCMGRRFAGTGRRCALDSTAPGKPSIFPSWRLSVTQAVGFLHPVDRRPVFIFPREGMTLVGRTDVDHDDALDEEPCTSPNEVAYLIAAVASQFPALELTPDDVVSTLAGVRPVIGSRKADPSGESRDSCSLGRIWPADGHRRKADDLPAHRG